MSMMRRISASTFCMVASDTFLCVWIERPRKISPSFSPYTMVPSSSDMPHCVTMRRAISVARSKSFAAPVVIWCMNNSSATRPPNSTAIMFISRSRSWL